MLKKAVTVVQLVEENAEEPNEQIEKEISEELSKDLPKIPWFKKVEKVTVTVDGYFDGFLTLSVGL